MSIPHLPFTEGQLQGMGLAARHEHSLLTAALFAGHTAVNGVESGVALNALHLPASVGIGLAVLGPPLGALAGMCEIADAHEEGDALARRNAWKTGFARTLQSYSHGQDWHAANVLYRAQETRGRNAAARVLRNLTVQERRIFVRQFAGPDGYRRALAAVGGIET